MINGSNFVVTSLRSLRKLQLLWAGLVRAVCSMPGSVNKCIECVHDIFSTAIFSLQLI